MQVVDFTNLEGREARGTSSTQLTAELRSSAGPRMSDFKVTARPAAVALGALTMAGRNNQDVMAR